MYVCVVVLVNKDDGAGTKRNSRFDYHPPAGAAAYTINTHTHKHKSIYTCNIMQSARPVPAHRKKTAPGAHSAAADNTISIALYKVHAKSAALKAPSSSTTATGWWMWA